jgi:hypothetical protein
MAPLIQHVYDALRCCPKRARGFTSQEAILKHVALEAYGGLPPANLRTLVLARLKKAVDAGDLEYDKRSYRVTKAKRQKTWRAKHKQSDREHAACDIWTRTRHINNATKDIVKASKLFDDPKKFSGAMKTVRAGIQLIIQRANYLNNELDRYTF